MKLRLLIIVAAILAVLTTVGYYIRNKSLTTPEDDPLVGTQLVDQDVLADVTRIEITKEDSTAILELDENNVWVVRSLYDMPADFGKLNTLVRNLVDAKVQRKITALEDRLARLDLTQGTVKLMSGESNNLFEVTFGKSLTGGKSFQFGDERTAYLASESPFVDATSLNWAVKTLYEIKADDVAGIQFSLGEESWAVRRDDTEKDFMSTLPVDNRTPKQSAITSLISRLGSLRFTEVLERSAAEATQIWQNAQENVRSVKFTLFSGETITVKMSQWEPPKSDDEDAPASTEPSETYLHISSSQADHSINSVMDRLAFKASSYSFTGIPVEITEVADLPEQEPDPESEAEQDDASQVVETAVTNEEPGESELPAEETTTQPEIKQHIDGNSVIFEVTPPQKEESTEAETDSGQADPPSEGTSEAGNN